MGTVDVLWRDNVVVYTTTVVVGEDEKMPENTNAILRMSSSKDSGVAG